MSVHSAEVDKSIDVETGVTLTGAAVELRVAPPNATRNTNGTYNPTFTYTGAIQDTTKIRHTKTATTFNIKGIWIVQARVVFSGGEIEYGDEVKLNVNPSL